MRERGIQREIDREKESEKNTDVLTARLFAGSHGASSCKSSAAFA